MRRGVALAARAALLLLDTALTGHCCVLTRKWDTHRNTVSVRADKRLLSGAVSA